MIKMGDQTLSRILVTGGAGFIGSNLCEALLEMGHDVRVFDNFSTGKRENLAEFASSVELIEGDIRDYESIEKAVNGVERVIHLAAMSSVPWSVDDPEAAHHMNATGTLHVLKAARDNGAQRVVIASTSAIYGENPVQPKTEEMIPEPRSPYAATKLAGEHYCAVFSAVYGLETVALRYFNVYGKRQDPASHYSAVIPKFITRILSNTNPVIYGDGEQTRDFVFVDDCNQANIKACFTSGISGNFFNIGSGANISVKGLAHTIRDIVGVDIDPVYEEARVGDVRESLSDISKARRHLAFEPAYTMEAGLKNTVEWYRGQNF